MDFAKYYDTLQDDDETPSLTSTPSRYAKYVSISADPSDSEQPSGPAWLNTAAGRAGMGLARGVASTLEPLALPQDVAFAIAAGNADPDDDTTISDRLKRIEWAKYAPFGAAPARPADGKEILELMGEKDPTVTKWGGLVLDLVADPLMAGSAIRGAGRLGKVEGLVKLGDKIDEATSIGGIVRSVNRVPVVRQWTDARMGETLRFMRNPENKLLGYSSGEWAQGFLSTRIARNLRYGKASGEAISDARALADQAGSDVYTRTFDMLAEAENGLLGKDTRNWFKKSLNILSGARKAEEEMGGLKQIVRDAIVKEGYDYAQKQGVLLTEGLAASSVPEVQKLSPFSKFVPAERRAQAVSYTGEAVKRVRDVAQKNAFDPDVAEERFRTFSQRIVEVDALHSYHVSGHEWIRGKVMERVQTAGGSSDDAARTWDRLVSSGMQGQYDVFLNAPAGITRGGGGAGSAYGDTLKGQLDRGVDPTEARAIATKARNAQPMTQPPPNRGASTTRDATGPTYREVLFGDNTDKFSALDLGAHFRGLQEGHMRRTYAMFQDKAGADAWITSLQQGRVVMSNILGDEMIDAALSGVQSGVRAAPAYRSVFSRTAAPAAPSAPVADLIKGYRSALEGEGRGTILTQRGLVNHLLENGVSKRDAQDAFAKLVTQMNPELEPVVRQIRDHASKLEDAQSGVPQRGRGVAFYGEREDIDVPFLEALGELANPVLSLAESAGAARTRVSRQGFMQGVHDIATQNGLVRDGHHTDDNGAIFKLVDDERAWGAFSGKHLHPYLRMELQRSMKPSGLRDMPLAQTYDRIRSMITGGYLASPSVVTANIAGGIYTSAMAGISPDRMMRAMAQSFMPLLRGESDDLKQLRTMVAVEEGNRASQDAVRHTERLKLAETGATGGKLQNAFDTLTGFVSEQLNAPLGQKWAGLSGFQFVEKWLRTSAFKAERDYYRANPQRIAQFIPNFGSMGEVERTAAIDKFAAQKARISAMDYTELPDAVTRARDSGLVMFPGFSFLIMSRNLNAFINRPGKIAVADRLNEAVWSAQMDEDEKLAVYAGMPDWLREEGGVPVRMMVDEAGDKRWSVIPMQGLLPTNTTFGKPFAESLASLGLYSPFFEALSAFATGTGEAPFTARYGKQVFSPDARGGEKYAQAGQFLADALTPGFLRKGVSMVQTISRSALPMDKDLAQTLYSFQEREKGRAQRQVADEVLSAFLRSPQVITTSGPLSNVRKNAASLRIRRDRELREVRKRIQRAAYSGEQTKVERLTLELQEREREYAELVEVLAAMHTGGR